MFAVYLTLNVIKNISGAHIITAVVKVMTVVINEQYSCSLFDGMNDDSSNIEVFKPSKIRRRPDSFLSDSSSIAEKSPVGAVNYSINTVDRLFQAVDEESFKNEMSLITQFCERMTCKLFLFVVLKPVEVSCGSFTVDE